MGKHIFQVEMEMYDFFFHILSPWQVAPVSSRRLKESLFCVFLRPNKHKVSLGALGFPGGAGRECVCSELRCHCQGAGEVLLRLIDNV